MSFTLRVMIEGLCVFFPDPAKLETEVIFVKTPGGNNSHTCQIAVGRGIVTGKNLPFELTEHDVHIYDGKTKLDKGGAGKHTLTNLPHYSDINGFQYKPRKEVRRLTAPDPKVNAYWVGRIQLFDGFWIERDVTVEDWDIAPESTSAPIGKPRRYARRLIHEYEIQDTYAQIEIKRDGNSDFWKVEPAGGFADILIGNYSHVEPKPSAGTCGVSKHFKFSLDIFENPPTEKYVLVQTSACSPALTLEELKSIHFPCVGGCAC